MDQARYIHDTEIHNPQDPEIIVPVIVELLKPDSVVDVGCGIGNFLKVFKDCGVRKILGLDGNWVNRNLLRQNIDENHFRCIDIENGFSVDEKFDLAICLEVLEHIPEEKAETAIQSLCSVSDVIVFSSAIPGQGGQSHVNEQWPEYWMEKFNQFGFTFFDVLRPIIWSNEKVSPWYRQNIFLVSNKRNDLKISFEEAPNRTNYISFVHPQIFANSVKEHEKIMEQHSELLFEYSMLKDGKLKTSTYLKLLVKHFRALVRNIRIIL